MCGCPRWTPDLLWEPCLHTALATAAVPHDSRPRRPPPATARQWPWVRSAPHPARFSSPSSLNCASSQAWAWRPPPLRLAPRATNKVPPSRLKTIETQPVTAPGIGSQKRGVRATLQGTVLPRVFQLQCAGSPWRGDLSLWSPPLSSQPSSPCVSVQIPLSLHDRRWVRAHTSPV